jgi:hypothetical protein
MDYKGVFSLFFLSLISPASRLVMRFLAATNCLSIQPDSFVLSVALSFTDEEDHRCVPKWRQKVDLRR